VVVRLFTPTSRPRLQQNRLTGTDSGDPVKPPKVAAAMPTNVSCRCYNSTCYPATQRVVQLQVPLAMTVVRQRCLLLREPPCGGESNAVDGEAFVPVLPDELMLPFTVNVWPLADQ